jgi:drug/metabolite transporter (DMT)-like permease
VRHAPSPSRRLALRASLALTASAACWGLATVATKGLLEQVPPITLFAGQLLASVTFLWAAVLVTGARPRLDRSTVWVGLSGLFEPGLAYTVGVLGLSLTTASSAALIGASEPPLSVLLAGLFLKERIGLRTVALVALAAAGVVLLMLPDLQGLGGGSILGDGLVALSALAAAIYVTISRRLVASTPPLVLSALQQSAGLAWALGVVALGWAAGWEAAALPALPATTLLAVALSGIVQYAAAFWLYLTGLQHLPSNRAALFLTLIPVFGVGGTAVVLGERLALAQWVGAAVVLTAIGLIVRAEQRRTADVATAPAAD